MVLASREVFLPIERYGRFPAMISLLCPTRGRPKEFLRMVHSVRDTSKNPVEILAWVDADDPKLSEYPKGHGIRYYGSERLKWLTETWNRLAAKADGDIFCQANDDIVFRTDGWDVMVEEAFAACPDRVLMVHGDDLGCHGARFGPHPFVHRMWYETLGYFIPPYFSSDYGDTWVNEIADNLQRRQFLPFIVEHLHFIFGKAQVDDTTKQRLERHKLDNVDALYKSATMQHLRNEATEKLREKLDPSWQLMQKHCPHCASTGHRWIPGITSYVQIRHA